jgi:DNA-binding transcriptional regulator YiaG
MRTLVHGMLLLPCVREQRIVRKAKKEAGEGHHDLNGGDLDVSAKAEGHSKETREVTNPVLNLQNLKIAIIRSKTSLCFFFSRRSFAFYLSANLL